jgi:hypothetical protein
MVLTLGLELLIFFNNSKPFILDIRKSEIKHSLETVNNPFESNESVFLSTDSRATTRKNVNLETGHRRGVHKYKHKRIDYEVKEDPDIQREIDKGNTVNILYDSSR